MKSFILLALSAFASEDVISNPAFAQYDNDGLPIQELTWISVNTVAPCQYVTGNGFWNFAGIANGETTDEDQIDTQMAGDLKVTVNLCESDMPTTTACTDTEAYAFIEDTTTGVCQGVRSADGKVDTTGSDIRDDDQNIIGLSLTYAGSAAHNDEDYSLTVNVICSTNPDLVFVSAEGDAHNPILNYSSEHGCPVFTLDVLSQFLEQYAWLWGAVLILLGAFLAFFGNKFVTVVIFLVVGLGTFLILAGLLFYAFLDKIHVDWGKWLALAGIIAVAAGVGLLVARQRKYGIALVSGWGGVMLAFVVNTAFTVEEAWLYWVIIAALALACFYMALKLEKLAVIFMTSFVGSYAFVRGISLYAGGFPSESQLREELQAGVVDWAHFDKRFYAYLGAIAVMTIGCIYYQRSKNKEAKDDSLKRPIM